MNYITNCKENWESAEARLKEWYTWYKDTDNYKIYKWDILFSYWNYYIVDGEGRAVNKKRKVFISDLLKLWLLANITKNWWLDKQIHKKDILNLLSP